MTDTSTTGAAATTPGTPAHENLLQKVGDIWTKFKTWLQKETVDVAEDVAPTAVTILNALKNNYGIVADIASFIPGIGTNIAAVINSKGPQIIADGLTVFGGLEALANPTADNIKAEAGNIEALINGGTQTQQQKFYTSVATDLAVAIAGVLDQNSAGTLTWGQAAIDVEQAYQQIEADINANNTPGAATGE